MADNDQSSKINSWDGNPDTYVEYKRCVELLCDGTKTEDFPRLAPTLAQHLTGNAWTASADFDRTLMKQAGTAGVEYFLTRLFEGCTGTQGQSMGCPVMEFMFTHHRLPGQPSTQYATESTRKKNTMEKALLRLCSLTIPTPS